jgi:hypothetical protein
MTPSLRACARGLLSPKKFFRVHEIRERPSIVPGEPGIYGWWFSSELTPVPVEGTLLQGEWRLLYIGICAQRTHISAGRALFAVGLKITAEGLPRHQLFDVRWLAFCS